jgi:hypothetical protein
MKTRSMPNTRIANPADKDEAELWPFRRGSPLGFEAGDENLYRYATDSPTGATDPSGLELVTASATAAVELKIAMNRALGGNVVQFFMAREAGTFLNRFGRWVFVYPSNEEQRIRNLISTTEDAPLKRALEAMISAGNGLVHLEASMVPGRAGRPDTFAFTNTTLTNAEKAVINVYNKTVHYRNIPNIDLFRAAGRVNRISDDVIDEILAAAEESNPWRGPNMCGRWVNNFISNISTRLKTPDFAPLRGTGLTGAIVTWDIAAYLGLTDSHATYRIRFPNGAVFYFDNTALSGNRITRRGEVGIDYTNETPSQTAAEDF